MVPGGIGYDSHIQGLERLAQAIHDVDSQCRLVVQIGHSGETVSPSGIKWPFPWKKKAGSFQKARWMELWQTLATPSGGLKPPGSTVWS